MRIKICMRGNFAVHSLVLSLTLTFVVCLCVVILSGVVAASTRDIYIPPELEPWRDWALEGKEYVDCPFFFNKTTADSNFVCAWPGHLSLSINAGGGRFDQSWVVYAGESWLALPGDITHWPQQVRVDGGAAVVIERNSVPSVRLGSGTYQITGRLEWSERPRTLRIPAETGLVALTVDGRRIDRPERNGAGLWLGERRQEKKTQDALSVQVYRLVEDDVPIRLTTRVQIDVSGSVREELLGPALPDGFVPLAITSGLPARLEPDGNLRLQVRPGSWELSLTARATGVMDSISPGEAKTNWPSNEIWSYRSNDHLRVTAAEGLPSIDPSQAQVPGDWQQLPAYRMQPGEALRINERSRGMISADNQLELRRQLWMDFNGDGFAISDQVSGTMRSDWRLDMAAPYALLSAKENDENLLVTVGDIEGLTGVELRRSEVIVSALGRTETRGEVPVTGWQNRFNKITTQLNLPPGNKLFAALGADESPGSWVSRWKLLDFFLVLIITIAAAHLFGRGVGALALVAVVLSFHEAGTPVWIWLNLLAAVALVRVAPEGRFMRILKTYRVLSFAVLVLMLVPFITGQIRIAIYPQLEPQRDPSYLLTSAAQMQEPPMAKMASQMFGPAAVLEMGDVTGTIEEIVVTARKSTRRSRYARYAPNAIVQTGPGRPSWQWNSYQLSWSGPVDPERTLRLLILPRWLISGLRFIIVLLVLGLAAIFAREIFRSRWPWAAYADTEAGGATAAAFLIACTLSLSLIPVETKAETPPPQILEELKNRLLAAPDCAPRCAELLSSDVSVTGDLLTINMTANAIDDVAIPLPGSPQGWRPERIMIDGAPAAQVYRDRQQVLWVRMTPGNHRISLSGPVPPVDSLEVPFPAVPRVTTVTAEDWFIAGIDDRRLLSGSLQLTRLQKQSDDESPARWESTRFPAFVRIERTVMLDLDWRVVTQVYRVAPTQGAITLNVPLLEGESVITQDISVTNNQVLVSMNPTQQRVAWESTLPRTPTMTIAAEKVAPWKEVWSFGVSGIWHAEFNGVPESETGTQDDNVRYADFYPRPGESLTLRVTRPMASTGGTLAFDLVQINTSVGDRSRTSTMSLNYRSTRGAQHVIQLPAGSEVMSVSIDGDNEPLAAENGELTIPIMPGEHIVQIKWRDEQTIGMKESTPQVDLGAAASNISLVVTLPLSRWILGTSGPRLGPAVMYWSELAALILFAVILGRIKTTPLTARHWVLLGLGFSTFSWPVLGVVVAWLLALGWRSSWTADVGPKGFNGIQTLIATISVVALVSIVTSLPNGLLGTPDMHVTGNGSYGNTLMWFADHSDTVLPRAAVVSVPLWIYKTLILAWALWLSFALIRWLPWGWRCFSSTDLWRPMNPRLTTAPTDGQTKT